MSNTKQNSGYASESQVNSALDTFDHVVVLMLENRSFDNLLGFIYPTAFHHPHPPERASRAPPSRCRTRFRLRRSSNRRTAAARSSSPRRRITTSPIPIRARNITTSTSSCLTSPTAASTRRSTCRRLPCLRPRCRASSRTTSKSWASRCRSLPGRSLSPNTARSCSASIRRPYRCCRPWPRNSRCSITGIARYRARPGATAPSGTPQPHGAGSTTNLMSPGSSTMEAKRSSTRSKSRAPV